MARIKCFQLDIYTIKRSIQYYKDLHERYEPVLLLNNNTFEYLKDICLTISDSNLDNITDMVIYGCKVAIANWVPTGEIELR